LGRVLTHPIDIDITHHGGAWDIDDIHAAIKNAVIRTVNHADYTHKSEISIVLADDAFIQDLNKRYRHKDKPTNVLSFPQEDDRHLGDVIFAYETIARESKEQNKSFKDHFMHLIVHGVLHLLGFDHETDKEASEMEKLEIEILKTLGISNPYF
jgi:probable rRNA maturation factor